MLQSDLECYEMCRKFNLVPQSLGVGTLIQSSCHLRNTSRSFLLFTFADPGFRLSSPILVAPFATSAAAHPDGGTSNNSVNKDSGVGRFNVFSLFFLVYLFKKKNVQFLFKICLLIYGWRLILSSLTFSSDLSAFQLQLFTLYAKIK